MGPTADWGEHDRYYGTGSGWTVGDGRFPLSLSLLCVCRIGGYGLTGFDVCSRR